MEQFFSLSDTGTSGSFCIFKYNLSAMLLSIEDLKKTTLRPFLTLEDSSDIEPYLRDESNFQGKASRILFPRSRNELSEILYYSQKMGSPLTISANRTSLTGSAIALDGNILSLEKMETSSVQWHNHYCYVPAMINYDHLQKAAREQGLDLPVDPTSAPDCTIGGAVATNCSGSRSFKYGPLRSFISYLDIMLPTGESLTVERGQCFLTAGTSLKSPLRGIISPPILSHTFRSNIKNTTGYFNNKPLDLIDCFIGSEGTLGVCLQIGLTLLRKPVNRILLLMPAEQNDTVLQTWDILKKSADHLLQGCLCGMDYIDSDCMRLVSDSIQLNSDSAKGFFILELETREENIELLELFDLFMQKHSLPTEKVQVSDNKKSADTVRSLRHEVPEKINQIVRQQGRKKIGMDFSVPAPDFAELFYQYQALKKQLSFPVYIFGHIGEENLHVNLLPHSSQEHTQAVQIVDKIAHWVLQKGGTLSSEHGIGKSKKNFLKMSYTKKEYEQMKKFKLFWDPGNILNRGNLFDED